MPENIKTSGHGGKRKGAGRTAVLQNAVNKTIRFEKKMIARIAEKGHDVSTFIREATERRLEEDW